MGALNCICVLSGDIVKWGIIRIVSQLKQIISPVILTWAYSQKMSLGAITVGVENGVKSKKVTTSFFN